MSQTWREANTVLLGGYSVPRRLASSFDEPRTCGPRGETGRELVEVRFVAMPANSSSYAYFGEKHLPNGSGWRFPQVSTLATSASLTFLLVVVVTPSERGDRPLALQTRQTGTVQTAISEFAKRARGCSHLDYLAFSLRTPLKGFAEALFF